METRISSKGQITIPTEVRRKLKVKTGDTLIVKSIGENNVVFEVKRRDLSENKSVHEDILLASAGLWKDREDIGSDFVRVLRQSDRILKEDFINE
ncbi:MAG: AbrB/MazE/SpoVT family DNA-binding domain-containing protein [Bacillota bacterium]